MKFSRILALAAFLTTIPTHGQTEPGWFSSGDISLEELAATYGNIPVGSASETPVGGEFPMPAPPAEESEAIQPRRLGDAPTAVIAGNAADAITPEIANLARGLQYDPVKIFNFVRTKVDYEAYFGCKKGAALTLLEMSGNDYDQAALLVSLLRASGFSPTYHSGPVLFTYEFLSEWVGIKDPYSYLDNAAFASAIGKSPTDPDLPNLRKEYALLNFFDPRGFPIVERVTANGGMAFGLPHVWVSFNDGQQTRHVSPSAKSYEWTPGINVGSSAIMSKAEILSQAGGLVSVPSGTAWVSNINYTALSNLLSTYTNRLLADLKANHDAKPFEEIASCRRMATAPVAGLESAIPMSAYPAAWSSFETWTGTSIPDNRMSKLVVIAGTGTYNPTTAQFATPLYSRTFPLPSIGATKLSLTFSGNTATIGQDDVVSGPSTFTVSGASMDLNLRVTHPHYKLSLSGSTYTAVQTGRSDLDGIAKYLKGDNNVYALCRGFDNPQKLVRKRQEILERYRREGLADSHSKVRSEMLNLMGLNWCYQTWRHDRMSAGYLQILPLFHHRLGRVAYEGSASLGNNYIDFMNQHYSVASRSLNGAHSTSFGKLAYITASSMEHGVVEQATGVAGVSTVRMMYVANQAGDRIFRIPKAAWSSASGQLQGYQPADINAINASLSTTDSVAFVPEYGNRGLNSWIGVGYAIERSGYSATKISGELHGGNAASLTQLSASTMSSLMRAHPAYLSSASNVVPVPYTAHITPQQASWDPVDMLSGAYILDKADMSSGGLSFTRHYNSHRRFDDSPGLGYGWTYGHHIRATERHSSGAVLGETNSYQAAAQLISSLASNVVYFQNGSAKEWTVAALITHWGVEQMQGRATAITFGNKTLEFIRMPDGSFIPPPGMNLTLTKSAGTSGVYTLVERHGSNYLFDTVGRIDTITDVHGNVTDFSYNASGQLETVTDAYGRTYTYSWSGGRISSISDGTGRSVGFGYALGQLQTVTDVEGKAWTYQYDADLRMKSLKDPESRMIVENDYDSDSRVIRQRSMGDTSREWNFAWSGFLNLEENPEGNVSGYQYDGRGRSLAVIDALNHTASVQYDGQDRMTQSRTPKNELTVRTWDSDNNIVTETDPQNHVAEFRYDSQKRVERYIDRRGKSTYFTYTSKHQIETITDPLSHVTTYAYHPAGQLKWVIDAETKKVSYDYDQWGQLHKITFPDGKFQEFQHNQRGALDTFIDQENRVTSYTSNKRNQLLTTTLPGVSGESAAVFVNTYDDSGNLHTLTDAKSNTTVFTHNALGKLRTTTQPSLASGNNVITINYDLRDWLDTVTNSSGHTTSYKFDAAQRIEEITDPLNRLTKRVSDANGQVSEIEDPLHRITKFGWTPRGEQDGGTDGLNHDVSYVYDANGNLGEITNRRGKTYVTLFDDANRPYSVTTPEGKETLIGYYNNNQIHTITEPSGQVATFTYDGQFRVQTLTDPAGSITYGYDDSGLLKTTTQAGIVIQRTYDERGRLKTFTTADGDLIQYRYDSNNNLKKIIYPADTSHPLGKEVQYAYNARNQLETVTDWASRTTTYSYDRLGRLTGITRPNGTVCAIGHDGAGQMRSIKESLGGVLFSYLKLGYDDAGQIDNRFRAPLKKATWSHPSYAGTFDDDNRLLSVNGQGVTHDDDGNMTHGPISEGSGQVTLSYNSRNQLGSAGGLIYAYDAEGRRRTITDSNGTTRYVIDPNGPLSRLLVKHAPDGSRTYYVHGLGLLYEVDEAESTKTYHFDQVGSTIARTSDSGQIIGTAEYSAYGIAQWKTGDMATPFLYNGQFGVITDSNGLLHMRARYYSPYLMRFLNADPIGFDGGLNWYGYADGDPISGLDPSGNVLETIWDVANLGIGIYSLQDNVRKGNWGWAALDTVGLIYDGVATAVPFLPAGASAGFKAARAGNSLIHSAQIGSDVARVAERTHHAAKAVDVADTARVAGTKIHKKVAEEVGDRLKNLDSTYMGGGANKMTGPQPDLVGRGLWGDITTPLQWKAHVRKYQSSFGEGIPILYERGRGVVDSLRLRAGAGAIINAAEAAINAVK